MENSNFVLESFSEIAITKIVKAVFVFNKTAKDLGVKQTIQFTLGNESLSFIRSRFNDDEPHSKEFFHMDSGMIFLCGENFSEESFSKQSSNMLSSIENATNEIKGENK